MLFWASFLSCRSPEPPAALRPLSEYRVEDWRSASVYWHPDFDAQPELAASTRAALDADLGSFAGGDDGSLAGVRLAVAPASPALDALPSQGRGVGFHRSSEWLALHGFDRARTGVVEVYNASDYLEKRSADAELLHPLLRASAAASAQAAARPLPLVHYRAETLEGSGFVVLWHPDLDSGHDELRLRVRAALGADLATVQRVVPADTFSRFGGQRVAVNLASVDEVGAARSAVATHRSADWLVAHGFDAERVGVIEVYEAEAYLRYRDTQPMVVLHELTHVLQQRPENGAWQAVEAAYDAAMASGDYEEVAHVAAPEGPLRRAYALNNAAEYGAELSEAYFGRNDFFPFDRTELAAFDPKGCAAVARAWGVPER